MSTSQIRTKDITLRCRLRLVQQVLELCSMLAASTVGLGGSPPKMCALHHLMKEFGLQMRALAEMENSGVVPLLEGDKYEDLQRMYMLFKRVEGGLDLLRGMLSEHLKSSGKALIMDPERTKDPVEFVHRLLSEKDKYDR